MEGSFLVDRLEYHYDENLLVEHIEKQLVEEKERGITIGDPIVENLPTGSEVRKFKRTQKKLRGVGFTKKSASKRKK